MYNNIIKLPSGLFDEARKRGLVNQVYWYIRIKPLFEDAKIRWGDNKFLSQYFNVKPQTISNVLTQLTKLGWIEEAPANKHWKYEIRNYHTVWNYFGFKTKEQKRIYKKGIYYEEKVKSKFTQFGKTISKTSTFQREIPLIKFKYSKCKKQLQENIALKTFEKSLVRWIERQLTDKRFSAVSDLSAGVQYSRIKMAKSIGLSTAMSGSNICERLISNNLIKSVLNDVKIKSMSIVEWKEKKRLYKMEKDTYIFVPFYPGSYMGKVCIRSASTIYTTDSNLLPNVKSKTLERKETTSIPDTNVPGNEAFRI